MAHVSQVSVLRKITRQTNNGFVHAEASMQITMDKDDSMTTDEVFEMAWNRVNQEVMEQMGLDDTPKS